MRWDNPPFQKCVRECVNMLVGNLRNLSSHKFILLSHLLLMSLRCVFSYCLMEQIHFSVNQCSLQQRGRALTWSIFLQFYFLQSRTHNWLHIGLWALSELIKQLHVTVVLWMNEHTVVLPQLNLDSSPRKLYICTPSYGTAPQFTSYEHKWSHYNVLQPPNLIEVEIANHFGDLHTFEQFSSKVQSVICSSKGCQCVCQ